MVLDQNTINQIAAGEVIERPAAVVKELVENAIDAGATAITAEIKEGGINFIRITDNGSGIEEEDMPLVFLRHSTSKIKTAQDLLYVSSLGFRGEALSSIAAVAQVELITKTSASYSGIHYQIAGGEEQSQEHIGCPNGTTFIIRNLFFNTPARRKFLKSAVTEAGYISELMERLAVSHPNISFKFINNNQIKLHTSGNDSLKDVIYNVFGRDITANLLNLKNSNNQVSIRGFIAKPIVSRGNRNYENYFINGRYIRSNLISKAIEEAYKPYTMSHRYPFTSIHIDMDSELIDVNVHPAKLEIRFKNGEELYQLIYHTIKSILEGREMIPDVTLSEDKTKVKQPSVNQKVPEPFEEKRRIETEVYTQKNNSNSSFNHKNISHTTNIELDKARVYEEIRNQKEKLEAIQTTEIGKLKEVISSASTLVRETSDYLSGNRNTENIDAGSINTECIIDENDKNENDKNDNEKYVNEKDVNEKDENKKEVNEKDINIKVAYNADQIVMLEEKTAEQLSFISEEAKANHRIIGQLFSTYWIVEFGDKMFLIDQHAAHEKVLYEKTIQALKEKQYNAQILNPPIILSLGMREEETIKKHMEAFNRIGFEIEEFGGREYAVRAVPSDLYGLAQNEILIELIDELVDEVYNETPEMVLEKIASMSCKAAVKGNQKLSAEEAKALIDQLLTLENPYHCPHGRPTIVSMSKYEIEKKFKRIV